jgi:NAD dependent epimerase/dehydratase family enzyme
MGEMSATVLSSARVLPSKALTGGFNYRFEKLENAMGEVLRAMST